MSIRSNDPAADEAVRQLQLASQSLLSMLAIMKADLPVVTEDWTGRFRHTFDYESARHHLAATTLANTLHLAADGIRAKQLEANAAIRLQARREAGARAEARAEVEADRPPPQEPR